MRAIKLYLPAKEKIDEFLECIDFAVSFGIDTLMLELGGAMEYETHPEINVAWIRYTSHFKGSPDAAFRAQYANNFPKNAIHWENGGGGVLSKTDIGRIVEHCAEMGVEIIPEEPLLTHCDYLLYAHREFAERQEDVFPDHYCPSDERIYGIIFDMLGEIIELFRPKTVNIGHDELYTVGICERCRGKDPVNLYFEDILKLYSFLKAHGVRTAMWADKLLCSTDKKGTAYGGNELQMIYSEAEGGGTVIVPAIWRTADLLPKDILLFHWHYLFGEHTEDKFISHGFEYVFSNLNPVTMPDVSRRSTKSGCRGFCVSNWAFADRVLLQRNGVYFHIAYMDALEKGIIREDFSLKERVIRVSEYLYDARTSLLQGGLIRVEHASLAEIPHRPFADGNFMNYEKDCLGEYELIYADGTVQREKIYFGLNINLKHLSYEEKDDEHFYLKDVKGCLLEATYSCKYIDCGDATHYEYAFQRATESALISWKFVAAPAYAGALETYRLTAE